MNHVIELEIVWGYMVKCHRIKTGDGGSRCIHPAEEKAKKAELEIEKNVWI